MKYGFIDVQMAQRIRQQGGDVQVLVNGEDVTNRCLEADDVKGTVLLHKLKEGCLYLDPLTNEVATVRLTNVSVEILL